MAVKHLRIRKPDIAGFVDQLEELSHLVSLTAIDAALRALPRDQSAGFAETAAKVARLSEHLANAADQLVPALKLTKDAVQTVPAIPPSSVI